MQTQQQVEVSNLVSSRDKPVDNNEEDADKLDFWLIQVGQNQDKEAFSLLFSRFAPKIRVYGMGKFKDPVLAMDLVQETMSLVWRKAALFNHTKGNASGWIFSVMRNYSFDMLRKMQSNKEDMISSELWPLFDKQVEAQETDWLESKQLRRFVARLPKEQRIIVEGLYVQGLTQSELSERIEIPIGTVKSRLRLALGKLRQEYEND